MVLPLNQGSLCNSLGHRAHLCQGCLFIRSQQLAVAHNYLAVDQNRGDIVAPDRVDKVRVHVVEGDQMGAVQINDDDVGALATSREPTRSPSPNARAASHVTMLTTSGAGRKVGSFWMA